MKLVALVVIAISTLLGYVATVFVYGFGVLVGKTEATYHKIGKLDTTINDAVEKTNKQLCEINERIAKIDEFAESEDHKG